MSEYELEYEMELMNRLAVMRVEGLCRCQQQAHIWFENCPRGPGCHEHHEPPPDYCETCGGIITAIEIRYVEDWRSATKTGEVGQEI